MMKTLKVFFLATLLMGTGTGESSIFDSFGKVSLADGSRIAFVASVTDPTIIAVDTAKNEVAATITIPHISGPIVVSDRLKGLYVTDPENEQVTVIDLVSREVVGVLDIGMRPDAALLNPFDRYIAFGSKDGQVSIWDMQFLRQVLHISNLESAVNMTFGLDGRNLFVVEQAKKHISVIEMQARKKVAQINLGGPVDSGAEVSAISRSADGSTGFVSVTSENRVVVIDLVNWKVKASIRVGGGPVRPFSPADNRYVLIPHRSGKSLTVLSALSYEVIATVKTGVEAKGLNTGWLDTVAFIMPETGNRIGVVDLDDLELIKTIELPGQPDDGLVTSDSRKLFTAMLDSGAVAAIDTKTHTLTAVIETTEKHLRGIEIALSNNVCH